MIYRSKTADWLKGNAAIEDVYRSPQRYKITAAMPIFEVLDVELGTIFRSPGDILSEPTITCSVFSSRLGGLATRLQGFIINFPTPQLQLHDNLPIQYDSTPPQINHNTTQWLPNPTPKA
jgi:hypothetical protein